jgi:hypothetical protein
MAKRGFLRESGGQDAQSERPASWHGQARSHRRDPWKSLINQNSWPRETVPGTATGKSLPSLISPETAILRRKVGRHDRTWWQAMFPFHRCRIT